LIRINSRVESNLLIIKRVSFIQHTPNTREKGKRRRRRRRRKAKRRRR